MFLAQQISSKRGFKKPPKADGCSEGLGFGPAYHRENGGGPWIIAPG